MASDTVLPGQPIVIPRGPVPQLGSGTYLRDGQVRASLMGVPRHQGSVGLLHQSHYSATDACSVTKDAGHHYRTTAPTGAKLGRPWICHSTLSDASQRIYHGG